MIAPYDVLNNIKTSLLIVNGTNSKITKAKVIIIVIKGFKFGHDDFIALPPTLFYLFLIFWYLQLSLVITIN